jgi:hypothetical protein
MLVLEIFSAHVQTSPGTSNEMGKAIGRGVDHASHQVPMLKKEKCYTSTPLLSIHGMF